MSEQARFTQECKWCRLCYNCFFIRFHDFLLHESFNWILKAWNTIRLLCFASVSCSIDIHVLKLNNNNNNERFKKKQKLKMHLHEVVNNWRLKKCSRLIIMKQVRKVGFFFPTAHQKTIIHNKKTLQTLIFTMSSHFRTCNFDRNNDFHLKIQIIEEKTFKPAQPR